MLIVTLICKEVTSTLPTLCSLDPNADVRWVMMKVEVAYYWKPYVECAHDQAARQVVVSGIEFENLWYQWEKIVAALPEAYYETRDSQRKPIK
jgi:hypothetical protein